MQTDSSKGYLRDFSHGDGQEQENNPNLPQNKKKTQEVIRGKHVFADILH